MAADTETSTNKECKHTYEKNTNCRFQVILVIKLKSQFSRRAPRNRKHHWEMTNKFIRRFILCALVKTATSYAQNEWKSLEEPWTERVVEYLLTFPDQSHGYKSNYFIVSCRAMSSNEIFYRFGMNMTSRPPVDMFNAHTNVPEAKRD